MLRWLVRASVAGSANSDVRSESDRASRKASDAKRQFDYAKRERDRKQKGMKLQPPTTIALYLF